MKGTGTRGTRRTTAKTAKPDKIETIDFETLLPKQGKKTNKKYDDIREFTHTWTRTQGEGAAPKHEFRVVGIETKRVKDKPRTKQTGRWKLNKAEERWEGKNAESIIYIPTASFKSFADAFPSYYTDKNSVYEDNPEEFIDLWITGPRIAVVENLQKEKVLPELNPKDQSINDWLSQVAISIDNYNGDMAELYNDILEQDKQLDETKKDTQEIHPDKIYELVELAKAIRGKKVGVKVLDVNKVVVVKYGEKLKKPTKNVFTDRLVSLIDRGKDLDSKILDISELSKDMPSKVEIGKKPEMADPRKGDYGTTTKRPLGFELTFTYKGESHDLGKYFVWTTDPSSVQVLFAEMDAVNENTRETGMSYSFTEKASTVRTRVAALLDERKEKSKSDVKVYNKGNLSKTRAKA